MVCMKVLYVAEWMVGEMVAESDLQMVGSKGLLMVVKMVVRWVLTSAGYSVLTSVDLMDMMWAEKWALV